MTKDEFQKLLNRYKAGSCTSEEIQKINDWFATISNDNLELNNLEKKQVKARILSTIRQPILYVNKEEKTKSPAWAMLKIAASVALLMLVAYVLVDQTAITRINDVAQTTLSTEMVEHKNTMLTVLKITLPDSSSVELKPNAEIFYTKNWDKQKREVHLTGEAFFEVVRDTSRPFYVFGGKIVTKVLGTSFSVNAQKDAESIEVAVRTGKVSVYEGVQQNTIAAQHGIDVTGVILTPNEKVEYFVEDKHWVTSLVASPKPMPTIDIVSEFVFSGTTLEEMVNNIEKSYAIDIIIENETSYTCTFTGDVSKMELYDMLDVICKSIGVNYEVKGTKILITGRGCQ